MPLFVCNSRFSRESRLLRHAASQLGWETLRLDGWELPDWVDSGQKDVAIFSTVPQALDIAEKFDRTLLGCGSDWLVGLPEKFLRRDVSRTTLKDALETAHDRFVKGAISKILPAKVYSHDELEYASALLSPELAVFVAEPVHWLAEYRCFVANGIVEAMSVYRRHGLTWQEPPVAQMSIDGDGCEMCVDLRTLPEHDNDLHAPETELAEARVFAAEFLASNEIRFPPAFVLDIGIIEARGWAVVESNECWASGIYNCEPAKVLSVLTKACISAFPRTKIHDEWDFATHYRKACPHAPQNAT